MFSTTSAHALRAMAILATMPPGEALLAKQLAQDAGVPLTYLSKILAQLTRTGLLAATRGINGGYRLTRSPSAIRLLEIVELFEPGRTDPECVFGTGHACSDDSACAAHGSWKQVRRSYLHFLEHTRLLAVSGGSGDKARQRLQLAFGRDASTSGGEGWS